MLSSSKRHAFTLLEIMLVVAIIALLLGAGFAAMGNNMNIARATRVKGDLQSFDTLLRTYESLNGFYPTTEQGLNALVNAPQSDPKPTRWYQLIPTLIKDPWQSDYVYIQPGIKNPKSYDIYSKGPDRTAGTQDDIGNWEDNK